MTDTEKITALQQTTVLNSTLKDDGARKDDLEPYLVILSGPDQGKQHRLSRQFNTFGRTGEVDITIADLRVSRKHGAFIVYPDCIILEDYRSTNGCFVDGVRIERQVIELTARIRIGNTLMKIEYKKALEVESEKALYLAANTDSLTNIPNRRAFMVRAQEEFAFCRRSQSNLTVVMCDVDHFKRINDNFGHPAGDQVLVDLAGILNTQMRKEDMLARYGGEEFIMLLRGTNADSARIWAERVRERIEKFDFVYQADTLPITLSIGICSRNGKAVSSLDGVIRQADDALYTAKNNGRNRVEVV